MIEGAKHSEPGYNIHHIVEQTSAEAAGYPRSQIDDPSNLAKVPEIKHWQLNRWFDTKNPNYENKTPREYVKDKDWEVRRKVGLDGLREVGVLK